MLKELEVQNSQNSEHELSKKGSDLLINLNNFVIHRKRKYKSSQEILFEVKNKDNGNLYLAKILDITRNDDISQKISKISHSMDILSQLNHPCLLKYIGYSPNDFDNKPNPIIFTEYAIKNRLNNFIKQNDHSIKYFNDTLKLICIYGIASALAYLHSHNIIYDDLKPSDVFFDKFFIPKISSLAIQLLNNEHQEENCCIINNSHDEANSSKKSNVYSFGIIVNEIMSNEIFDSSEKSYFKLNKALPSSYQNLIKKCILPEPRNRPTFDEIVEMLKSDLGFITETVSQNDYMNFVKYIDESKIKVGIHPDQFINSTSIIFNNIESNNKKIIDLNRFYITKPIGNGSFGTVFQVKEIATDQLYAAKINDNSVSTDYEHDDNALNFFREVKLMSIFNHPSLVKFVGFSPIDFQGLPYPTTIMEFCLNGSLRNVIELEKSGLSPKNWNETKKLITIYGIAAGLYYMHLNDIIHRDLKPDNILMDENMFPKISDFGLSKSYIKDPSIFNNKLIINSLHLQTYCPCLKGTPTYLPPESLFDYIYTKANDVFAFSIVVYEILTLEKPYPYKYLFEILTKVAIDEKRPILTNDIPDSFQKLLTKCWDKNPENRPTFQEIIFDLKTNKNYINECVDENEYHDYIYYIENSSTSFDLNKSIRFNDIKKAIDKKNSILNEKSDSGEESQSDNNDQSEIYDNEGIKEEFNNDLAQKESNESNEINHMDEDINDPEKQFSIGKNLIEGNNIKKDIELGIKFLEKSINNNNTDSLVYYCRILIEGKIISKDINTAKKYLEKRKNNENDSIWFLYGKIKLHEKQYKKAIKYIKKSVKKGNKEAMFEYGKLLFCGKGCIENNEKAMKYMHLSMVDGFEKSRRFILIYSQMCEKKCFICLSKKNQLFFITQTMKNSFLKDDFSPENQNSIWKSLNITLNNTKEFYSENLFSSQDFVQVLDCFEKVLIQVEYPSKEFDSLKFLITNDNNKANKYIISISFSNSVDKIEDSEFKEIQIILENDIPNSVKVIGDFSFFDCSLLDHITIPSSVIRIGKSAFEKCYSLKNIVLSSSLNFIDEKTFQDCISLTHISIPSSVSSIRANAFKRCSLLSQISIPSSVTFIDKTAFDGCLSLKQAENKFTTSTDKNTFIQYEYLEQISIPSFITNIGEYTFKNFDMKQIAIPSSVTSIGNSAFERCSSLTQITIPSSVTSIGNCAFFDCKSLTQIAFPSSLTSIGNSTFAFCKSLTQITIPSSVTSIGWNAFLGCSSLTQITIPSSVTSIGNSAFSGCSSLTQITIPSSVTSIGNSAFSGCSSLTQITIPSSITKIQKRMFEKCISLEKIFILSSVIRIEKEAFLNCISITHISIPSSVKFIEESAFCGCSLLKQILIPSVSDTISKSIFYLCYSLIEIIIPSTISIIEEYAFCGCSELAQISIPSSLIEIKDYAFYGCYSLTQISIPSSVYKIGCYAFCGCSSLTQISIPFSVTIIDKFSFYGCSSLTQISIPSSVTIIDKFSFYGCSSLARISIPSSVTVIGNYSFYKCSSMEQVSFETPSSLATIGDYAFYGIYKYIKMSIPHSVTKIGYLAFGGCKLSYVSIPDSVTKYKKKLFYLHSENENLFHLSEQDLLSHLNEKLPVKMKFKMRINDFCYENQSFTRFTIPSYVTYIGECAFRNCSLLTKLLIPSSVTYIGESSFRGCSSLTNITLSSSLTSIKKFTFSDCISLTDIRIPYSVTSIDDYAFWYCESLKTIYIPSTVQYFGEKIFDGIKSIEILGDIKQIPNKLFCECIEMQQISIPSSVTSFGDYSFAFCFLLKQITIPPFLTSIGNNALMYCWSITNIIIPSTVTSIGDYAFKGCSSLTQLTIPSSVKSMGDFVFNECSSLNQIEILASIKSINDCSFLNCKSLTQITIPSSVTKIGRSAFEKCYSLKNIVLPSSVSFIDKSAFQDCTSLIQIEIPSSLSSIKKYAFSGCSSLVQITIPSSVEFIGKYAFSECSKIERITILSLNIVINKCVFLNDPSLSEINAPSCLVENIDINRMLYSINNECKIKIINDS